MKHYLLCLAACLFFLNTFSQKDSTVTKKDRKRDVELVTSMGTMRIRLSDSTPLHRDNFIKLVKVGFYDSLLFHRVIKDFMIQTGDPNSKNAPAGQRLGFGGPGYRVPAEFRTTLFHKKGMIAAARDNNPEKASSGSQFYLTQGKVFKDAGLDSVENFRINRKIPLEQREIYKTVGGIPHLDQGYTVFGEVVRGVDIIDKIAAVSTEADRPKENVYIIKARMVKRKKK